MIEFIMNNLATILIGAAVLAVCSAIAVSEIRRRKKGGCGCGCAGCVNRENCHLF